MNIWIVIRIRNSEHLKLNYHIRCSMPMRNDIWFVFFKGFFLRRLNPFEESIFEVFFFYDIFKTFL